MSGMSTSGQPEEVYAWMMRPILDRLPALLSYPAARLRPTPYPLFCRLTRRGRTLLGLVGLGRRRACIVISSRHGCDRCLRYRAGYARSLPLPLRVFVHALPQLLLVPLLDCEGHGCDAEVGGWMRLRMNVCMHTMCVICVQRCTSTCVWLCPLTVLGSSQRSPPSTGEGVLASGV